MRIGSLARATGASARSLRYYEQQGLLVSERSPSGQRHYDERAVERVGLIKSLLSAGLPSATIYEVLPCISEPSIQTPWLAARLRDELHRIDQQLTALQATRGVLDELVTQYEAVPVTSERLRSRSDLSLTPPTSAAWSTARRSSDRLA